MNFATMDNLAVNHSCWLQRCSLTAKALFVFFVLGLVLTTRSLPFLGGLALVLIALTAANRLPLSVLGPLALAPMFFASIFAISLGDWEAGLIIFGRAGIAALTVALVFVTTPPVRMLGLVSAPMPELFGGLLYFTYRSLFLIWATLDNTLMAIKLRRGMERFSFAKVKTTAHVYGMTLLRAWDMAGRQYALLRLRGIDSGLRVNRDWSLHKSDWGLLALTTAIAMGWYYV